LATASTRSWSQVGLAFHEGLLELIVRHSDEPTVVNAAQFNADGACRLANGLTRLLSVDLDESRGAKIELRSEFTADSWSELSVARYRPKSPLIADELVTFTVQHSDEPYELNGATVPTRYAVRILAALEDLRSGIAQRPPIRAAAIAA